jgi:hypothetical protein
MKNLWLGFALGIAWCFLAEALLAWASRNLVSLDVPWKLVLIAATVAILGANLLIIIILARASRQPVPTRKQLSNEYYVVVMSLPIFLMIPLLGASKILKDAWISQSRATVLFGSEDGSLIFNSDGGLLYGESTNFYQVSLASIESGATNDMKPGWVRLAQRGAGVLRITSVTSADPEFPIGMELPVNAPTEEPNWGNRVRIGRPSLGSPIYFPPATLEARFTNGLHPLHVTNITGVLVLPVIVPENIAGRGPDPDGWIDVRNEAIIVESDPVVVTVVPESLSYLLIKYRNDPLNATIWMFPGLVLYLLILPWIQARGQRRE